MPHTKLFVELREECDKLQAEEARLDRLLSSLHLQLLTIETETLPTVLNIAKNVREEITRACHDMKSIKQMVSNIMDYQDKLSGVVPPSKGKK